MSNADSASEHVAQADASTTLAAPQLSLHNSTPPPPTIGNSTPPPPTTGNSTPLPRKASAAAPSAQASGTVVPAAPAPSAAAAPPAAVDKVPFRDLFQFATPEEIWMMRFACFCAAGLGLIFPLFSILFGELLNSLNGARSLADVASDFSLKFLIIALCAGFGGSVSYGLPVYVAERQMKRVRELYLGSILRQEPAWFDVNKPGEVSSRLAEDTLSWQNGIADKFTQVFANVVGFVASIVIGFNSNWRIALAVLAIFPGSSTIFVSFNSKIIIFRSDYGHHDFPQSRHIHGRKARLGRVRCRRRLQHRNFQQHPHSCRVLRGGGGGEEVRGLPCEGA
jgi:hypothetical protein